MQLHDIIGEFINKLQVIEVASDIKTEALAEILVKYGLIQ